MKYKIGDQVWIKKLIKDKEYGDYIYSISSTESDISEKLITLKDYHVLNEAYGCDEYSGITDQMINHKKTKQLHSQLSYEIY